MEILFDIERKSFNSYGTTKYHEQSSPEKKGKSTDITVPDFKYIVRLQESKQSDTYMKTGTQKREYHMNIEHWRELKYIPMHTVSITEKAPRTDNREGTFSSMYGAGKDI